MDHGRKTCTVYVNVDNLADVSYIDYMSRFKYYTNEVNGKTQVGVNNMGRNVSIKVIVPLDFKSK